MKKNISIILTVLALGVGFTLGTLYGKSSATGAPNQTQGQFGAGAGRQFGRGAQAGNGFIGGQVVAADATSITLQLPQGGSRVVLVSSSTEVRKSVGGTSADLAAGEEVTVTGKQNTDGSFTAQSVQIRPASSSTPRQ